MDSILRRWGETVGITEGRGAKICRAQAQLTPPDPALWPPPHLTWTPPTSPRPTPPRPRLTPPRPRLTLVGAPAEGQLALALSVEAALQLRAARRPGNHVRLEPKAVSGPFCAHLPGPGQPTPPH